MVTTCNKCGKEYSIYNSFTWEDNYYCEDCHRTLKASCVECDEKVPVSKLTKTVDGWVCAKCLDDLYQRCADCSDWVLTDNSYTVEREDRVVCGSCYDNYIECHNCGNRYHTDNMLCCEECDRCYCQRCGISCDCERDNGHFMERTVDLTKNIGKTLGGFYFDRFVGLEIEVERGCAENLHLNLPKMCGIVSDGSLDETGVEILTPPASGDQLRGILRATLSTLREANFEATASCGLHTHFDVPDIKNDGKTLARLLKTYYATEDILFSMLPPSRWHNRYCRQLRSEFLYQEFRVSNMDSLERRWYKVKDKRLRDRLKRDGKGTDTRYNAVNLHSVFYRGTLELRHHGGTINYGKIKNWINLNFLLINYTKGGFDNVELRNFLHRKMDWKKVTKFCEIFEVPKPLEKYLRERIKSFNPDMQQFPIIKKPDVRVPTWEPPNANWNDDAEEDTSDLPE